MRRGDKVIAFILLLGFLALVLSPFTFFAIRPGEAGVLYHLFGGGTETNYVYDEGIGVKWPWNRIYRYEVRTQNVEETVSGLASDGLTVDFSVTVLYHPIIARTGLLHKEIGPDYAERLVRPTTTEAVRDVIGKHNPHDLYRIGITTIEQQILQRIKLTEIGFLNYRAVIVRKITLPPNLNDAITRKLTEEQNAQAYDYLIQQAEKEAARKRVEAIGIQTFYSIVANSLSPQLLTWRGIEATVQLSRSPNTKIVIVGGGKDQLPLILGSDIASQPNVPAPTAADPNSNPLPDFNELPKLFPDLPSRPSGESGRRSPDFGGRSQGAGSSGESSQKKPTSPPSSGQQ
jgi:regulator of protease activity HflC (stomatin/prohibitin superfamily)